MARLQLETRGQMLAAPAADNLMPRLTKLLHQMASQMVPRTPPAGLPTQLVEGHKRLAQSSCMQNTFVLLVIMLIKCPKAAICYHCSINSSLFC